MSGSSNSINHQALSSSKNKSPVRQPNKELSKKLKTIERQMRKIFESIEKDEIDIKKIDDNEISWDFLHQPFAAFMGIVGVFVFGITLFGFSEGIGHHWYHWCVRVVIALIAWVMVDHMIVWRSVVKKFRLRAIDKKQSQGAEKLVELYTLSEEELSPELHALGIMSAKDVILKTSANQLGADFVEEIILDHEVESGRMKKLQLKTQTLYQSLKTFNEEKVIDELHELQMFTLPELIQKTSLGDIHPEYPEYLLNQEIAADVVEKIQLKDRLLYKSKILTENGDSFERIELNID